MSALQMLLKLTAQRLSSTLLRLTAVAGWTATTPTAARLSLSSRQTSRLIMKQQNTQTLLALRLPEQMVTPLTTAVIMAVTQPKQQRVSAQGIAASRVLVPTSTGTVMRLKPAAALLLTRKQGTTAVAVPSSSSSSSLSHKAPLSKA